MLRHKICFDGFGAVDRSKEDRHVVPKFKNPVRVEYARDGDVSRLLSVVSKNTQIELVAAVGAGKSTVIPYKLAQASGKLVFHVIPFPLAASVLASYLATTVNGDHITYMDDLTADFPSHGVVIVSSGYVHARLARDSFAGLRDALLYLDEVHESDAATAVLRELAPALQIFSCVVKASATNGPGVSLTPHLPGSRTVKTFTKVPVTSWSANDKGKPWSATSIEGNILICMDRVETREKLRMEYMPYGFDVRVCTKDTDRAYYDETIRRLKDPNHGIVIVFVDYAYRSSLTIPMMNDAIESGEVAVPAIFEGAPIIRYRAAFDFEVQQFFGRCARLPGEKVTLWQSTDKPLRMMCDLESLEGDAANLLYRLKGFRPPLAMADFAFFEGKVPIDIAAAIVSDHPMALCPDESLVPWINGDKLLVEDKEKPSFKYEARGRVRPNVESCYTEHDSGRPNTPPPPVPAGYAMTRVDVNALREYRKSRDSSPSLSTVYTLDSELPDNLSVLEDGEYQAFAKPKRIAKHVREERAAAAAMAERARLEESEREWEKLDVSARLSADDDSLVDMPDDRVIPRVSAMDQDVGSSLPARRPTAVVRRFHGVVDRDKGIHQVVRDREVKGFTVAVEDDQLGNYVYYHGMDKALKHSQAFWLGIRSVLQFGEKVDSRLDARGLPPSERLYAMKTLVDEYNNSTAVAVGIQRLFMEVSGRPPEDWHGLVNHDDLVQTVDWMTEQCTSAQSRARLCRDVMLIFMDYALDIIPPALDLEQKVMREMMHKFEKAAVKKDPDKALEYISMLNNRSIRVTPQRGKSVINLGHGR